MNTTTGTAYTGLLTVRTVCPVCLGSGLLTEAERCPDCIDGMLAEETT